MMNKILLGLTLISTFICHAEDLEKCITKPVPALEIVPTVEKILTTKIPPAYQNAIAPLKDALEKKYVNCSMVSLGDTFTYCHNETEIHGFNLTNVGSDKINPAKKGAYRSFHFLAPQSARQDLALEIEESGCTMGHDCNDSDWTMESVMVFFPRKVIPALKDLEDGSVEVTIPTGEKVIFSKDKEITGGVLTETTSIDRIANRFTRKFAGIKYTGKGIVVRADQRAETPRSAVVWKEKKMATITWGSKTCKVSPAAIWLQEDGGGAANLYAKDEEFYSMLKNKCNWNVSEKDLL